MTAYPDSRAHLRDELRRLDLLLARYLAAWRADRGGPGEGGGFYVADEQVDRLLAADPMGPERGDDPAASADGRAPDGVHDRARDGRHDRVGDGSGRAGAAESAAQPAGRGTTEGTAGGRTETGERGGPDGFDERIAALADTIRERERATAETDADLRLVTLADRFGLTRRHVDVLLVALAPELDLKYETVYAYLQDDLTRKRPTVGLALRVVGGTAGDEASQRTLLTPGSPLLDGGLLRLAGTEGAVLPRPVEVDRRVVAYLLGEDPLPRSLQVIVEPLDPATAGMSLTAPGAGEAADPIERLPVPEAAREGLSSLRDRVDADPPAMLHLQGPYGSGREAAAVTLAAAAGRELLALDAGGLSQTRADEAFPALVREARLREAAVLVRELPPPAHEHDAADGVGLARLVETLDDCPGPVFLAGEAAVPARLVARLEGHRFAAATLERPSFDLRRALWAQKDLPGDPAGLASKFLFTAGQIEDAATTARAIAVGEPTAADVREACRRQSRERLGDLARQVQPTYGWDDIVLPEREMRRLREIVAHVTHQGTVYSEWGFDERYSVGTGVNVLFAGPSGTGKTMAAEVIANEAGLDLFSVDLASVVSKYIGETESNLGRVFDEAETSNAILFFDEADALFGERSEVSDAHDRYANVEVDYLLQRMEDHDGVVVLATNLEENMDDAFQRRINLTVDFPLPDRDARERIWRGVFPDDTPIGDLDREFLADFDLAGGSIKNAALTAAFLAADDDGRVEMRHAVAALWRELQKDGQLVSAADFDQYREHLP